MITFTNLGKGIIKHITDHKHTLGVLKVKTTFEEETLASGLYEYIKFLFDSARDLGVDIILQIVECYFDLKSESTFYIEERAELKRNVDWNKAIMDKGMPANPDKEYNNMIKKRELNNQLSDLSDIYEKWMNLMPEGGGAWRRAQELYETEV